MDLGRPGQPDLGRPGRPGDHIQNLPSQIADRGQWQNWRQENLGNVRDYWQNNWGNYGDWYGDSWWNNNHIDYPYYPGFGFWAGAAWAGLSGWGDYGWTEPIYYSYGDNVYYDDGSVYYGDQPVCTEEQYIEQAEAIAFSVPEVKPAAKDWMPLGVFAITQDGEPTGADPTMFLQLALSKQGVINGTFQNTATNTVKAVQSYLLRTNLCTSDPAELWRFYIQLVEVEAAFKTLKHDLALRPIHHQLERRIEAHIFVAFLAYCLHVTLRARLRPLAGGLTPRAVLDTFAAIQMLDVHFPTTDGRTLILTRHPN